MNAAQDVPCLDARGGQDCEGVVEFRTALSPTGVSFPRCARHWEMRLDEEERLRRNYPDSPQPPPWFDPLAAGETWDEEG